MSSDVLFFIFFPHPTVFFRLPSHPGVTNPCASFLILDLSGALSPLDEDGQGPAALALPHLRATVAAPSPMVFRPSFRVILRLP